MRNFVTELSELVNRHIAASSHLSDKHGDQLEFMAAELSKAAEQVSAMAQRWLDESGDGEAA